MSPVPKEIFLTKGVGRREDDLHSFELELRDAGMEKMKPGSGVEHLTAGLPVHSFESRRSESPGLSRTAQVLLFVYLLIDFGQVNVFADTEGRIMKMSEVRKMAKRWGVDIRVGRSKQDMIRDIQIKEGYSPCYRTKDNCENDCLWREDCLSKK